MIDLVVGLLFYLASILPLEEAPLDSHLPKHTVQMAAWNSATPAVTDATTLSIAALETHLSGKLQGTGDTILVAAQEHGLDPAFLAAIMIWETGHGSSRAVQELNNVGGLMDSSGNTLRHFDSVQDSIWFLANTLQENYVQEGLVTPAQIQKKYAPVGVVNDPTQLNLNWVEGVTSIWLEIRALDGVIAFE